MKDISQLSEQLFETYAAAASKKVDPAIHVDQLLNGMLTLPPHSPQRVGPNFEWSADPIGDANWRFQYHTLLWLDNLRADSQSLSSAEGLLLYERLLQDWVDNNPVDSPPSDYSWFDMAVGVRAIVLVQAMAYLGPVPWLVESIRTHGAHLADEANYEGKGNHSLHQDMGLIVVAQLLEHDEWLALAARRIEVMFSDAIDSQGVSREGSIDYQYRNYRWYEEAARRLKAAGVSLPRAIEEVLPKMPLFMAHATSPSTYYALLGDTILHRAPVIATTATEWVNNSAYVPDSQVAVYEAGYLFARNNWKTWKESTDSTYLTLRFGPGRSTAVHGHEDAGSITFDAHGERLLCDSGLYAYEAGEDRLFFRGRSAHNVIDIPGRKYYPSAESPLLARQISEEHVMATVKVAGLQGAVWHRTLLHSLRRGYIIVDDRVTSTSEAPFLQRWQLPLDSVIEFDSASGESRVSTLMDNNLQFIALGHTPQVQFSCGNLNPIAGWRSEEYRKKVPSPELVFGSYGNSTRLSTFIHAYPQREAGDLKCAKVVRTAKDLRLDVIGKGWSERIRLASDGFDVSSYNP